MWLDKSNTSLVPSRFCMGHSLRLRVKFPRAASLTGPAWRLSVGALLLLLSIFGVMAAAIEHSLPVPGALVEGSSLTIAQADFCQSPDLTDAIPDSGCAWKVVKLAKLWKAPPGRQYSDAWYRLHFNIPVVPADGLAMYLVAFHRTGRISVNGHLLQEIGAMTEPLPVNWNRAQYAVIPPALLHPGANEIEIQQRAYWWDMGWLAPIRLGADSVLRPIWQRRVFWQNDLVQLVGACTGTIGLFILGVWLGRRKDVMYLWFGGASLMWSAISIDYYTPYAPMSPRLWEQFIASAQVLRPVLMYVFVLRYCGLKRPLLESAMWAYFIGGSVAIFGSFMSSEQIDLWYLGVLVVSPYFFVIQVRVGFRRRFSEGLMLAIAGLVQMALSGYDLWLFSENTWTDRVYLAHFGAPLYLVVVGTILIRRFVESLNDYEKLTEVLEARVGAKASELRLNYEQLVDARRTEALAQERTRMMSEMHDGIGSQLTMALSLVRTIERHSKAAIGEDGPVATVLRESIEDLQLIIDSLEPVESDLLTVLGTLRYRLQDRLRKCSIDLQWNVVDLPPLPMLTPHSVLSILRIVQEAFANCIKHSGATHIMVTTGLNGEPGVDETAFIRIVDNGRGMVAGVGAGRGLDSMRHRAASLGGVLRMTSETGRMEVLVEFPTLRLGPTLNHSSLAMIPQIASKVAIANPGPAI